MTDDKRFDEWNLAKGKIHYSSPIRSITEGEIWWCALGENIGVEINGKNDLFSRPIIILRKFSKLSFLGIPLTSKPHTGSWYVHFKFQNKDQWAALSQARQISTKRLYNKIGKADDNDFRTVKKGFLKLFVP